MFGFAFALTRSTGFATNDFLPGISVSIKGQEKSLKDIWQDAPSAYKGSLVAGFPNFAIVYGPNTNVNHTSVLALMECALDHFAMLVEKTVDQGRIFFQVKQDAQDSYCSSLQNALSKTVFNANCNSWYKKNSSKKIVNNYPFSLFHYWLETRRVDWEDIQFA